VRDPIVNTLEIIVVVLSVVLMLKAVVSAIYAGMAAARERLLREQTADQITAPADRLSRLRPVLPFASSAFGLIGVAGLAVLFALLFTGRGKDKPTLGANEMPRPTAENVPIPVSKTVPVQQQPEKPPVALAGGRTVEEIARKNDQAEVATADSSVQMAVRLAKTKQNEALLLASRVRSNSDELVAEMDRWDSLLSKLLTGDDGKALAAHPDLVRRYRAVVGAERPARTEIAEIQDQVSTLVEPIQAAYDNPADIAVPGAEVMKALSELGIRARRGQDVYRRARTAVESIRSNALNQGTTGKSVLRDAVAAQDLEDADQDAKVIEAATSKARNEGVEREKEAQANLIEAKSKAKAAGILREAEETLARIETEKQIARQRAEDERRRREQERIEALAADPQIQGQFRPLLDHGFVRYNVHPGGAFQKDDRPRPASFSDLSGHGWLKDVKTFAKAMAGQANTDLYNNFSDRSRYPMPRSDAEWDHMEELFATFKQVAPVWVKMKLLDP
jgi:hypothetical protein